MISQLAKEQLKEIESRIANLESGLSFDLRGPITSSDLRVLESVREALTQIRLALIRVCSVEVAGKIASK